MPEPNVKMVERIVAILRVLSESGPSGLALTELAIRTDLRKPTAHRLMAALATAGFVSQDLITRRYRLGIAATTLGHSATVQHVGGAAQPVLSRLALATKDTVFVSVREGVAAVCVGREVGSFPIRTLTLDMGDRRPLGVGAGSLALLAALPDSEVLDVINRNKRWLQDYERFQPSELQALVTRTRRDGFALNEGRIVPGMNALGVPVLDDKGHLLASLSVAAIKDRMGPERIPELVQLLHAEAHVLATMLMPQPLAAD